MKIPVLFLLLALVGFISKGQDHMIKLGTPYTRLKVTGNIHVRLVNSDEATLTVLSGTEMGALDWDINGGLLSLRTASELTRDKAVEVRLNYRQIRSMEINRGGRVQSAEVLKGAFLELDVLNGGKVELTVELDSLNARVNQGADIILYGKARVQVVEAYTWGNYLAVEMEAKYVDVSSATGAQVKLNAGEILKARATSGGVVTYTGDPGKKDIKTSLGGEVRPGTP